MEKIYPHILKLSILVLFLLPLHLKIPTTNSSAEYTIFDSYRFEDPEEERMYDIQIYCEERTGNYFFELSSWSISELDSLLCIGHKIKMREKFVSISGNFQEGVEGFTYRFHRSYNWQEEVVFEKQIMEARSKESSKIWRLAKLHLRNTKFFLKKIMS